MAVALEHVIEEPKENEFIWKLKNKALIKLDKERSRLNYHISRLEELTRDGNPSEVTGEGIRRSSILIKKQAKRIQSMSKFEDIVKEDITRNAEAAIAICDYHFGSNSKKQETKFSIAEFLKSFYGEKLPFETPLALISRLARGVDHVFLDEYSRRTHDMKTLSKNIYLKETFLKAEQDILPISNDIRETIAEFLFIPKEEFPILFYLDPTNSKESEFHSDYKISSIDPNKIYFFKKNGEERLFLGSYYIEVSHETGHGAHHKISEKSLENLEGLIPLENTYNYVHTGKAEGNARLIEDFSNVVIFDKNRKQFKLSRNDIETMKSISEYDIVRKIWPTYFDVLSIMAKTDPRINPHKKFADMTGIRSFELDTTLLEQRSFFITLYDFSTIAGVYQNRRIIKKLNEKYGRKTVDKNINLILNGMLIGYWMLPTGYRFFMEEYLPRAERFFK